MGGIRGSMKGTKQKDGETETDKEKWLKIWKNHEKS